jgi:hypothetical protein
VVQALGAEAWEAPLGTAHAALVASLASASGLEPTAWSEGQALSVVRTPALYGAAALLQAHGFRSLVVGTTNRDEGSYLGFFGKASDAMVDLQPISDLHKSEVRALAHYFGVPAAVVDAIPRGDVHDGRSDEEMIGASYDEIELYLRLRELGLSELASLLPQRAALERQHARNAHKYRVGDPAVHLDVLPRSVPGGWSNDALSPRSERRPANGSIAGAWDPPPIELTSVPHVAEVTALRVQGFARVARGVLSLDDCAGLCEAFAAAAVAEPVGVAGVPNSYGAGSLRASAWSPELSRQLWQRLRPVVPSVRFLDERSPTDGFATPDRAGHRSWRVVGLSPLLRFMRYERGGRHLSHYDAAYDYGDGRRTLLSVVFYLTDADEGGATRFVEDRQGRLPAREREFSDWTRDAREDEVVATVQPRAGSVLFFDHRLCHDVQRWEGAGARVIIRADVVYEAVADGRA